MELSANALTTIDKVVGVIKTYPFLPVGLDFEDQDVRTEIARLINYWSAYVQTAISAELGVKEYIEFYKGTNQPTLVLKHFPIKGIVSFEQVTSNAQVVSVLDVEQIMAMNMADDFKKGIVYVEPFLVQRRTTIGVVPEPFTSLRTYRIKYTAGYVLPKDETVGVPSDLPQDLENLVIELCKAVFIRQTDSVRAEGLITLTEGNVQRMWAPPTEFNLTDLQKKIIAMHKRKSL